MRYLVISDVHIGDARLKDESKIMKVIKGNTFDCLVLNGDFLDTWFCGYRKAALSSDLIDMIASLKQKVIWIRGNHDPVSSNQTFLPNAEVQDFYHTKSGGKTALFLHGHQVYAFQNMAWWSKLSAKFNNWLYRLFKLDIQNWWRKKSIYKDSVRKKREKILNNYGHMADMLIIGHTHVTAHQKSSESEVFDGGSVLFTNSYIIVDKGTVTFGTV